MGEYRPKNCNSETLLNEEAVLNMRERAKKGESVTKIAQDYNIGYEAARKAIKGITWRWVGGALAEDWRKQDEELTRMAKAFEEKLAKEFAEGKLGKDEPEVESLVNPKKTHNYY